MTTGLRERKKQETRLQIADAARRLFLERGFEAATVTDIAEAAGVSPATVFNYFPTKEDLLYNRLESFEEELLDAIKGREPGEPILAAFARFVTRPRGMLASGEPEAGERLRAISRLISDSPALLAREQQIYEGCTDALARLIVEETGARPGDVAPRVAANAMIGLHRALVDYVRRQSLQDDADPKRMARAMRAQARKAVALLERGLV